jgi:Ca2+-binding RTX toxin-like protein
VLVGGSGDDTLSGGLGADVIKGMDGNDQLLARDRTSDTINCDGGTTAGTADKSELDLLPKDSPATGCETVHRY